MSLTRAERDQFTATTPTDIAYGEGACLETPPDVFARLNERFKFNVDLTANEHNHLLPEWIGPGSSLHHDALDCVWGWQGSTAFPKRTVGFSNPPYGPFIPKILQKAIEERTKGFTSVFLLPNRAGGWFQDYVIPYYSELWYCASRLTFWYQGTPRVNPESKENRRRTQRNEQLVRSGNRGTLLSHIPDPALFDSIIVVYAPYDARKWGLFPPPQRPNVWNPRTGELRY